jgi:hypothetical protein
MQIQQKLGTDDFVGAALPESANGLSPKAER